jgi:serine/threonine protein kinase
MLCKISPSSIIGKGGGGRIISISIKPKDSDDNIKCVAKIVPKSDIHGIRSLFESYITKYLSSKANYLLQSYKIDIFRKNNKKINFGDLCIYMPEAFGDVMTIIRREKIPFKIKKMWMLGILKSILYLHSNNILHGDIKAHNVLVYKKNIKLADFGLSVLLIDNYTKDVDKILSYTNDHRPPEVFKLEKFSLPADIWALACTLYEIYYEHPLFPEQIRNEDYCQSFIDCYEYFIEDKEYEFKQEKFTPHIINPTWKDDNNKCFNSLLMSMFKMTPNERYTIVDVCNHPFFNLKIDDYSIKQSKIKAKVLIDISEYTNDANIILLASYLNETFTNIFITNRHRILYILSAKILYKHLPSTFVYTQDDFKEERDFLECANFDLKLV